MNDKIANEIALHQMTINELQEIKNHVEKHMEEDVRFRVETKIMFHRFEPYVAKYKDTMNVSVRTMKKVLDGAIKEERKLINQLIDEEVESRM